nr:FAD/NAD(P)-binding oxidoreductase family protein [Tanacetum cinerariifolium]
MELHEEVDIVIVGAGLAGLTTALALHRLGLKSLVLESSESLRITGFALTLWTNAWKALDAVGIGESLRQKSTQIKGFKIASPDTGLFVSEQALDKDRKFEGYESRDLKKNGLEVRYNQKEGVYNEGYKDGYVVAHYHGPQEILCLWQKLQEVEDSTTWICGGCGGVGDFSSSSFEILIMFKLEDVAMGIWIADLKKNGLEVRYNQEEGVYNEGCKDGYVIAHYQGPQEILCLWQKLQEVEDSTTWICGGCGGVGDFSSSSFEILIDPPFVASLLDIKGYLEEVAGFLCPVLAPGFAPWETLSALEEVFGALKTIGLSKGYIDSMWSVKGGSS